MTARKKSGILHPDDMRTNMYFTVLSGKITYHPQTGEDIENCFLKGDILQILQIDLPYVVIKAFNPQKGGAKLIIDVRDFGSFKKLSSKFVKAAQPKKSPRQVDLGQTNDRGQMSEGLPVGLPVGLAQALGIRTEAPPETPDEDDEDDEEGSIS